MRFILLITTLVFGAQAYAITPEDILNGRSTSSLNKILELGLGLNNDYQIGGEWGKKVVTQADLDSNESYRRMALSTANVRSGGTGFYLGEFNGKYIMASNHHVCPSADACAGRGAIRFPFLNISTKIVEFYGTWPEIDLSLFAIEATVKQAEVLNAVASPFAFHKHVYHGEPLVTIGFGVADNPGRVMVGNRDSDCKVYSADAEYRLMADPDEFNPGPYKAWSFANGCDVSHGDSGSAMMDRETGEVVGIIWTGRIPKNPKVQKREFMDNLFGQPTEDIWDQLSYSVPAVHMKVFLKEQIYSGALPKGYVETIKTLIDVQ